MFIAANWKAYVDTTERAKRLFSVSKRLALRYATQHEILLAPPAPFLGLLAHGNRSGVLFSAQDISTATGGAHTGEVTAGAARSAGASYAIVGHSERRAAGDTNDIVAQKMQHAIGQGLIPILCVGEHERNENAQYLTFVREEILSALTPLPHKDRAKVMLAYEPIWAIGKTASEAITSSDLTEMILYLRKVLSDVLSGSASKRARILYGGSVEPDNARMLAEGTGIDGFLIGHAATQPESFQALVKALV